MQQRREMRGPGYPERQDKGGRPANTQRDADILLMLEQGYKTSTVAKQFGITPQRCRAIRRAAQQRLEDPETLDNAAAWESGRQYGYNAGYAAGYADGRKAAGG